MTTKAKEETPAQAIPEDLPPQVKQLLAEYEAKLAAKEAEITELRARDEGWLVWTPNPVYDGVTVGVQFTNGMAFIPKKKVMPLFVIEPSPENQVRREAENNKMTYEAYHDQILKVASIPSSERCVNYLVNEFGYQAEFFSKDQVDELQARMTSRARERADVQARIGTQAEMLEKTLAAHRF